ncbi:hypothetical protein H0486_11805 [Lachnospiraceae bacterium MD1]|uniref:Plasmid pRiA4b Orf3-like domain-containing protein n=1 Tax=Variimorphobacter saccharofermentans TaxID=2755051 RepID=A0A839K3H0_9FIRM|nr:hypothetical protein [Variimorphobacter saccharofermentans]MBB2183559.1 hypothetical protein [Variimorphobacter saccharofermentans]
MELFQNAAERLRREYQCFLDYLEINDVQLSKRTGHIGKKDCFALNSQFDIVRERYHSCGRTQEYYTVIDFFYYFSVRTGILQIRSMKGKGMTLQKGQRYQWFSQMEAMEQYILMMTVWLGEYHEALGNSYSAYVGGRIFETMTEIRGEGALSNSYGRGIVAFCKLNYFHEVRIFALFQLLRIDWMEETEEDKDNKFRVKELYQTAEGYAWKELLKKQGREFWYTLNVSTVLPVIRKIVKNKSVDIKEKLTSFLVYSEEIGGHTIDFKITVGSCVRKILMGDQYTLEDLHFLIQKSVNFDNDHMYYFQIGSGTLRRRYFIPECEDEIWQADTVLAELMLYEGMQFEYLFDFGDQWHFQITVEKIVTGHIEECQISTIKGEAPEQYDCDWE